jgi:hypothetical protein
MNDQPTDRRMGGDDDSLVPNFKQPPLRISNRVDRLEERLLRFWKTIGKGMGEMADFPFRYPATSLTALLLIALVVVILGLKG